jgi:hypothetical protein
MYWFKPIMVKITMERNAELPLNAMRTYYAALLIKQQKLQQAIIMVMEECVITTVYQVKSYLINGMRLLSMF